MPREAFLADRRALNSAKYLLIVAAEAALDIYNHLAARRGGRSPEDYADCIAILAEIGAIDDVLRQRLVRMAPSLRARRLERRRSLHPAEERRR
jgi:uncharacterized protein YutE (UPF0331/DUF86 family)